MNYRFVVWQSVTVTNKKHPRFEQAGVVYENAKEDATEVKVKFDADGVIEAVSVDEVLVLR